MAPATTTTTATSSPAKKELVQKILLLQQPEIENVAAASVAARRAEAMQRQVPPEKREAMREQAIEAEVKKYVEESYPLVRERAVRLAPSTLGAALEEKFSEDELKQLLAWLDWPLTKSSRRWARSATRSCRRCLPIRSPRSTPRSARSTPGSASSSACRRRTRGRLRPARPSGPRLPPPGPAASAGRGQPDPHGIDRAAGRERSGKAVLREQIDALDAELSALMNAQAGVAR